MSYQVIARKYRPQRFNDVVGQEHVTQTLANAIRSGRVAHAYLFCGPRGTGKTTIARIFAKALNCADGPNPDFDDADPRCREITEGRSLDVLEIDGASNNGVEQVRELRETARFAPASSRFKIYIIDEVHMLTTAAFNALLKTLEEPPPHVKFLFATTDPEKVLPTILSRCQRFDLRRIPSALIVSHLRAIASAEGVQISDDALEAIARGADGGMRDAESTLDQLISFCGSSIDENDVLSMFGLAARSQILSIARAILTSDASSALRELNELARNGKDLGRLLEDLLRHFRNLMVSQIASGTDGLLDLSDTEARELQEQAKLAPSDAVIRVLDLLTQSEARLREVSARKIFLEVTLLKAIQARNAVSLDSVLKQLESLRDGGSEGSGTPVPSSAPLGPAPGQPAAPQSPPRPASASGASAPAAPPSVSPARASATAPEPKAPPLTQAAPPAVAPSTPSAPASAPAAVTLDPLAAWQEVVAAASPLTRPSLEHGRVISLERGILTIGYPPRLQAERAVAEQERVRKHIESKLRELGQPATVRFVEIPAEESGDAPAAPGLAPRAAAPAAQTAPAAAPRRRPEKVAPIKIDPAEFKNDPLVKQALEIFRGQLVEVRQPEESEQRDNQLTTG